MGNGDITPRAEYQTATKERDTAKLNRTVAVLGAAAAFFTLATAGLGFWSWALNNTNGDLGSQVDALQLSNDTIQRQLDLANARVVSRDEDIELLQEENRELRLYAPPEIPVEEVHPIRNAATVTLASGGDTIKLESDLQSFDYGPPTYEPDEFAYTNGKVRLTDTFMADLDYLALRTGAAEYATCAVGMGYSAKSSFDPSELMATNVCLRLESGRYAVIQVTGFDKETVDLQVTVWQ